MTTEEASNTKMLLQIRFTVLYPKSARTSALLNLLYHGLRSFQKKVRFFLGLIAFQILPSHFKLTDILFYNRTDEPDKVFDVVGVDHLDGRMRVPQRECKWNNLRAFGLHGGDVGTAAGEDYLAGDAGFLGYRVDFLPKRGRDNYTVIEHAEAGPCPSLAGPRSIRACGISPDDALSTANAISSLWVLAIRVAPLRPTSS